MMPAIRTPVHPAKVEKYRELLRDAFGMDAARMTEMKGGWSARAFLAEVGGQSFFLKVYDPSEEAVRPWVERIDAYIPIVGWLSRSPELRGKMAAPVKAKSGGYKVAEADEVFLLYEYFPGDVPGEDGFTAEQMGDLARILAQLHDMGTDLPCGVEGIEEDVSIPFCDDFLAFYAEESAGEIGVLMRPHRALISSAIGETIRLRDTVRRPARDLVLCHTDAHGFNVVQGEHLVVIDWEGLCIAPPEADLFIFPYMGYAHFDAFMEAYCAARPGFLLNEDMMRFYLLRRQVEDIWYFLLRALNDNPDPEEMAEVKFRIEEGIAGMRKMME